MNYIALEGEKNFIEFPWRKIKPCVLHHDEFIPKKFVVCHHLTPE